MGGPAAPIITATASPPYIVKGGAVAKTFDGGDWTRIQSSIPGATQGWTIAAIITPSALPTGGTGRAGLVGHRNSSSSEHDREILIDNTGRFGGYLFNGSESIAWSSSTYAVNNTYKVIVWYDPTLGTVNVAVDSVSKWDSLSAPGGSGYQSYSDITFGLGNTGYESPPLHYTSLALRADIAWTPQMRQAFFDNPWQIFTPTSALRVAPSAVASTKRFFIPKRAVTQPQQIARIDRNNPLTRGLVLDWNAIRPQANAVDGTPTVGTSAGSIISSQAGFARYWSGTQASGDTTWGTSYNPLTGSNQYTLEAFVNPTALGGGSGGAFISKWNGTGNFLLSMDGVGDIIATAENQVSTSGAGSVIAVNRWTYVAVTFDSSGVMKKYTDGVLRQTVNLSPVTFGNSGTADLQLARQNDGAAYNGSMAIARIRRVALTQTEILAISRAPWQIYTASPLALLSSSTPVVSTSVVGEYTSRGVWRGIFRGVV